MEINYLKLLHHLLLFIFVCISFTYSKRMKMVFNMHSFVIGGAVSVLYFISFINANFQFAFACLILITLLVTWGLNKNTISQMPYLFRIVGVLLLISLSLFVLNFYTQSLFALSFLIATTLLMLVLFFLSSKKKEFCCVSNIIVIIEDKRKNKEVNNYKDLKNTLATIHKWFDDTKCYLNSDYSLDHLEKDIKINRKDISLSINKLTKQNFYQFIAYYRVKHAKEMILNKNKFTLETLSSDCGFYSKSTFNKYFKKFEGQTPSSFKLTHS